MGKDAIPLVLELMHEGKSLRKACEQMAVPIRTFLDWVDADADLATQYTHARARMLDVHAEQLEEFGDHATAAESAVEVAGWKLKSDNRKWLLSKLAPKKYGDKITQEHTGADGGPVQTVSRIELVAPEVK
jgi:hypothetical protein